MSMPAALMTENTQLALAILDIVATESTVPSSTSVRMGHITVTKMLCVTTLAMDSTHARALRVTLATDLLALPSTIVLMQIHALSMEPANTWAQDSIAASATLVSKVTADRAQRLP